jgi:hypothetical protein
MQYEKKQQKPNTFQFKLQPGRQRRSASPYSPAEPSPLMGHYSQTGNRAAHRLSNPYGIPEPIKTQMENAFQTDFSNVTVTPNSSRAPQLGALAYTQGTNIHFAPGMYAPHTSTGQRLLGHELTHVVQQRQGRVRATGTISGKPLNDSPQLENEADRMGSHAANSHTHIETTPTSPLYPDSYTFSASPRTAISPVGQSSRGVIQGVLTRSMRTRIQEISSPEDLFIIMYRYPALAGEILEEAGNQHGPDLYNTVMSQNAEWTEEFRREGVEFGGSEEIDALAQAPELAREDNPEDAAEEYLNEEWHADQPDAPEEYVNLNEDIEENYLDDHEGLEMEEEIEYDEEEPMQFARNGNTITGPKSYKTKKFGQFTNVSYKTDSKGSIDFSKNFKVGRQRVTWKNPVVPGTQVKLNEGMKGAKNRKFGFLSNGTKVNIPKASRSQHFSIGDRILKKKKKNIKRAGSYTWHHLTKEYEMVLVDMTVHAKHGHNGGVYLWK